MLYEIYTSICVLTFLCHISKCSEVYDRTNDNKLYISNYCPTFAACQEGTHILCAIHAPDRYNHTFCDNSHNVSITSEMANKALAYINAMRSKIAKGKETGADRVKLPRGYGIPRVQWDPELALFAQIHANKCTQRQSICIATLKFNAPYQITITTRFLDPNWSIFGKPDHKLNEEKGLNNDKLLYALSNYYNSLHLLKNFITPEVIKNSEKANKIQEKYLTIINSKMTHVGCGISVFKTFVREKESFKQYMNHVSVTCNFSCYPKNEIYNTSDPKGNVAFTKDCGCRLPYKEDEDCLCDEGNEEIVPLQHKTKFCNETQSVGEPQLIVLPIISVENAPKDKLIDNLKTYDKSNRRRPTFQRQLIRNEFVPKNHRFEEVDYVKKDVVPRRDFAKVRKLTEIYISNNKNGRYLNNKKTQAAYNNGDIGLLYSTERNEFYNLSEKNGFNQQKKDNINEEFKTQIFTLLKNLEKMAENVRFKSNKKAQILKKIHDIFNILTERNDRDQDERVDLYYSANPDYKFILSRPILKSQRNTVREKADLENRYFIRSKTIDIDNKYDYANNDKMYDNNHKRYKTIQNIQSERQRRPLKI